MVPMGVSLFRKSFREFLRSVGESEGKFTRLIGCEIKTARPLFKTEMFGNLAR